MYYITIDCGTTNSRVYVVDKYGRVYGKAVKKIGVKDTAATGSKQILLEGLRETIITAVKNAGIHMKEVNAIFSSGMITSEIGLYELPHLSAPCNVNRLAENFTRVCNLSLTDENIPVYFVRGIKNSISEEVKNPFEAVGNTDFMRGEETQIAGIIAKEKRKKPFVTVILSSHTKFISVNKDGNIMGSLTTLSGQFHEAILSGTFVGKSVEKEINEIDEPEEYFSEEIVEAAYRWCRDAGVLRTLMFPRFLEVLFETKWYERKQFFEAVIAVEDMKVFEQLKDICGEIPEQFLLVGLPERCKLYAYILKQMMPNMKVEIISDEKEIDILSIRGILDIAEKAGVIN